MKNWITDILDKKEQIIGLAPMADMTDSPYCQIVQRIGGADIVFREMVSAEALIRDNEKTLKMIDFVESERPIVQQIFGAKPDVMAEAARIVMETVVPEGIDINMGCPVYKITSNFNGCALMKEPKNAAAIVTAIKSVIGDTPLSVKMRLGWTDPDEFKEFIPIIEAAGADLITIHGRTRKQGYRGESDWGRIAEAKKIATVPLLANGDILQPEQYKECLAETKADGALIARGALGNPWFFQQARDPSFTVSFDDRLNTILDHLRLHIKHYGERSPVTFRKHLAWYFKADKSGAGIPGLKAFKQRMVQITSYEELEDIFVELRKYVTRLNG